MQLSHSKVSKYGECPARYNFYYNKRWRVKDLSSSLFFGGCIDEALNCLLLTKKNNLTDEEKEIVKLDPHKVFLDQMKNQTYNGKKLTLPTYNMTFSKADYDENNITLEQYESIYSDSLSLDEYKAQTQGFLDWYYHAQKTAEGVTYDDRMLYNRIMWNSMVAKGNTIIDAYKEQIMPLLEEVLSIQKKVSIKNDDNDEIIGYIDFIARFKEDPENIYIVDNKTSSKKYKPEELTESNQLHLYAFDQDLKHIAYIVMLKGIRKKKEPRVVIEVMKGEVNEEFTDNLLDNFENVLLNIKGESFNPDFNSGCRFYGRKCEYSSICHSEKFDDSILEKVQRRQ